VSNDTSGKGADDARPDAEPATRPSQPHLEGEPPARPSATQLPPSTDNYPDDGPVAGTLRRVDHYAGIAEQALLFGLLLFSVLIGAIQALASKLFGHIFPWSFDMVRGATFAMAMLGAAYASHHASHFAMDIVSRVISARSKLVLQLLLGLFTIFAAYLLLKSGLRLRAQVATEGGDHTIPIDLLAAMIPAGCGLIMFHTFLRVLILGDYLRRGKLPPEKAPSAH
jgi:TRAP-type C4-dicarboxylate transport system permease small subunit